MILGPDKKKLSKRNGTVSANVYRAEGYLPEAVLNFLVRLGWSHGDQEIFSIEEMIRFFDFDHCNKASGVFNNEKLLWCNGEHVRKAPAQRLAGIVVEDNAAMFPPEALARVKTEIGEKLIGLIQPKVKLVKELAEQLVPLCTPGVVAVDAAGLKWNKNPELKAPTQAAVRATYAIFERRMAGIKPKTRSGADAAWGTSPSLGDAGMTHEEVDQCLRAEGEKVGVKLGDLAQPMRLAVTGRMVSAGLFELIPLLPWDLVAARLRQVEKL
jgi:glutamyl-tRNA synthetase